MTPFENMVISINSLGVIFSSNLWDEASMRREKMKFINIKQHDTSDCGPTCLAIITKFYRGNISIARLREETETNTNGTSIKGLVKGAEAIGYKTQAIKIIDKVSDNLDSIPVPCISHVVVDEDLLHYVVILKIDKEKIIISDPEQGIVKLPRESFGQLKQCNVKNHCYCWTGILILLSPTEKLGQKYQIPSHFSFWRNLVASNKKICCFIFAMSLLYTAINIGTAFYYKILIDSILPQYAFRSLVLIVEAFILLAVAKVVLNVLRINTSLVLGKQINYEISMNYFEHLLKLQQKFFDKRKVGELTTRFQDAAIIQDLLSKIVLTVLVDIIAVIVAGFLLFWQNKEMFFGLLFMCILYIITAVLFKNKYESYSKSQLVNEAQTMSGIFDFINGIVTVRASNAQSYAFDTIRHKFNLYLESIFRLGKLENLQYGLKSWIGLAGEILILAMGVIFIFLGRLTLGELITFNALIVYFFDPIRNLIDLQSQLQTALVATDRIQEIMELDVEAHKQLKCVEEIERSIFEKDIVFDNISFGYNSDRHVLQNFCLQIDGKSKVAIIGESGSGKSTITKLLIKLYMPRNGNIFIGGMNIDEKNIDWIRTGISYVSQDSSLFNISIVDNLLLGNVNISKEAVAEVCKLVKLHDYIMELPLQYDTKLEEGGGNLSSGQKQRLMLARAILRRPYILIMDEATSNLNYNLEKSVNDAIRTYLPTTTIIMVTHRASIVKDCDMIYVLENGAIKEWGVHQELLNKSSLYCRLLG